MSFNAFRQTNHCALGINFCNGAFDTRALGIFGHKCRERILVHLLDAQRDATTRQYAEQVSTWLEIATLLDKPELAETTADQSYLITSSLAEAEAVPLRVLVLIVTNRGAQPAFEAQLSVRWDTAIRGDQEISRRSFPVIPPTSQRELRVDSSNSAIIDDFAHRSESLRVELTFRDVAGAWWRRSTTGELEPINQP